MRNSALFNYTKNSYKDFLALIDKKNYVFRATLYSPDNIIVDLYKSAIKELYLNDTIHSPFIRGHIIIDNREDTIERYVSDPVELELDPGAKQVRGFRARGDARDLLLLSIIPVIDGQEPYGQGVQEFNKAFGIQYVFALTNEEDVIDLEVKFKKYELIDVDEQLLRRKIFFSSIDLLETRDVQNLSNDSRGVKTGKIMKRIIQTGLDDDTSIFTVLSGSEKITPRFEDGLANIFYTSPADYLAIDDLNYIYSFHSSNSDAKDFSILKKDLFTGEYTLEGMSSIFQKAFNKDEDAGGPYFIENLTITGGQNASNVTINDAKKPLKALELGEVSDVVEVKFFNPPGQKYQDRIRTMLIHSYDFLNKNFHINCDDGNIENVKRDFTQLYVKPMKGKNNNPAPNFPLNNSQKKNLNYDNEFMVYDNHTDFLKLSIGRNRVLKDALMMNLGVEIMVQGSLARRSGKFISIDRTGSYIDNDFDNKFLGIYLIVNVEHFFNDDDKFMNKIIAVKTYQFTDLKNNESIP